MAESPTLPNAVAGKEPDDKDAPPKANSSGMGIERALTLADADGNAYEPWIESGQSSLIFGSCIFLNALLIGFETDMRRPNGDTTFWDTVEVLFLIIFTVELVLRMKAWGLRNFFVDWWNIFDAILVFFGAVSLIITISVRMNDEGGKGAGGGVVGIMTTLRTVRLLRLCRVLRLFRFFKELYMLAQGIIEATRALVWVLILLFMVLFICSIFMTRFLGKNSLIEKDMAVMAAAGEDCRYMDDTCVSAMADSCLIDEWFGTMLGSMFTLFTIMTLEGWPDIAEVVMNHPAGGWGYSLFFVGFIMAVNITLLNLVTGIIVENVLNISRNDEIERQKSAAEDRSRRLMTLRKVFEMADTDASNDVSKQEFEDAIDREDFAAELRKIEIGRHDAEDLFAILDVDNSGSISLDEFIEGFSRVKGPALAKHLLKLHYDLQRQMRQLVKDVIHLATAGSDAEEAILERVHELGRRIDVLIAHSADTQASSKGPPPEVTSLHQDDTPQLSRELAHHYAALMAILGRFREKTEGVDPAERGTSSPDLLQTMRQLCAQSNNLLTQLGSAQVPSAPVSLPEAGL